MGFVPSSYLQRLLDLAAQVMPNVVTETIARTPKTHRLPYWDPYECSPEDMVAIRDTIDKMQLVYVPVIYRWWDPGMELANTLAGLTLSTISVGCQGCKGSSDSSKLPPSSSKIKYQMNICADVDRPANAAVRKSLIEFYVFYELIALAGGNAVDKLGLYTYFVTRAQVPPPYVASPPTCGLCLMKAEGRALPYPWDGYYAGKYTVWDGLHGGYYLGNKVDPTLPGMPLIYTTGPGGLPDWQIPTMSICQMC